MSNKTIYMPDDLHEYTLENWLNEPGILSRLRQETSELPNAQMQISPDQGQLMAVIARTLNVRRYLEIGVFTGYSSLAVALALPEFGQVVALDISEEFTSIARRYWHEAGVMNKIDLRIGPAADSLDALIKSGEDSFDLAFIDADKIGYPDYFEKCLSLVRSGGCILVDNVLWSGKVADPRVVDEETQLMRQFNASLHKDSRVDLALIPIADGLTICHVR